MKEIPEVKVVESFDVSHWGILVFLQHELEGLAAGCKLKSGKSGGYWIVKNRIIHFPEIEKTFENETISHAYLNFGTIEKAMEAKNKAMERQQSNSYQYLLEGVEKPEKNEVLEVVIGNHSE